jgi:DNA gyrase inhibitor GyrI
VRKPVSMIVIVLIILGIIWIAYSYLSVRGIEHPTYVVLKKYHGYEIREYDSHLVAEVVVKGTQKESLRSGFKKLFDYISGNNSKQESIKMTAPVTQQPEEKSERIAMTAPVMQEQREDAYLVSFMMPSNYTPGSVPNPKDPAVTIVQKEKYKVAVLRFAGYATEEKIMKKQDRLKELLKSDGYEIQSSAHMAFYNPPWTPPFMRRNEVMYSIQ